MNKLIKLLLLLPLVSAYGLFANTKENPRTTEVVEMLNLEFNGLEKVKNAATPIKQQEAIFEYFMNRNIPKIVNYSRKNPPKVSEHELSLANDSLEHKFWGQRAYPTQFRGKDVIDWDSNPFTDNEWIWQFHRFYGWEPLGKTYLMTGDERYAKEWAFELNSWVDHMFNNKNYENHPGWRPLEVGSRLQIFPKMPEYFKESKSLDSYTFINLLWSMQKQFISLNSRLSGMNNHRMHQWDGMLTYLLHYPEFKGNLDEIKIIYGDIAKCQKILMLDDGVINEYIPSYHTGSVTQFQKFKDKANTYNFKVNFSDDYNRIIQGGVTAVMLWSHPNGKIPQFGDAWSKTNGECQRFVSNFTDKYNRPDWEYFSTFGKKGKAPKETVHLMAPSGYATVRSSWEQDALFLVTKNSKLDKMIWHNHADNLSFELSAFGEELMVDSGCYSYFGSKDWRAWFRQPFAHQLVTLNNQPIMSQGECLYFGEFKEVKVISMKNIPHKDLIHQRTFFMVDNKYIVILDELTGSGFGELRQHFQFLPGEFVLDSKSLIARTMNKKGINLFMQTMQDNGKIDLIEEEGWISREYTIKEPRPAFAYTQEKKANEKAIFLTFIAPLQEHNQIWRSEISFEKDGKATSSQTNTIRLKFNNLDDYTLNYSHETKTASLVKNFEAASEENHDAIYSLEQKHLK